MWYLVDSNGKRLYLAPDKEFIIGRKKGDLILENDDSVSRTHASISIDNNLPFGTWQPSSNCRIKDLGSKYGTFIFRKDKMTQVTTEGCNLKHLDKIRFGLQDNIYVLHNVTMITVASGLSDVDKIKLEKLQSEIDIIVSPRWIKCLNILTVTNAALTEKIACAMVIGIPIVTMHYWDRVKHAFVHGKELPDPTNFTPPISEPLIDKYKLSLMPNKKRKTLFANLIFVYFNQQQYKTFGKIVLLGGGQPILYTKKPSMVLELCASNVIIIQYPNDESSQSTQNIVPEYDKIYNLLIKKKRRMIPESEIPLAVLHCSTEKYCNPVFNFAKFLKRTQSQYDTSEVLVLDTQDVSDVRILPSTNAATKSGTDRKPVTRIIPDTVPDTVPDTYDSSTTNDDSINQSMEETNVNEVRIIKETLDTSSDSDLPLEESKGNTQSMVTMPGAIVSDSASTSSFTDSFVNDDFGRAGESEPKSKPTVSALENSAFLTASVLANKGTPIQEVVDISDDEDPVIPKTRLNVNNKDESIEISDHDKSDDLFEKNNPKAESSATQKIELSGNSVSIIKKGKNGQMKSQTLEEFKETLKRKTCNESDNDERLRRKESEESELNDSNSSVVLLDSSSSSLKHSSPHLQNKFNFKKFKKANITIPKKRVTLKDMYTWNNSNIIVKESCLKVS